MYKQKAGPWRKFILTECQGRGCGDDLDSEQVERLIECQEKDGGLLESFKNCFSVIMPDFIDGLSSKRIALNELEDFNYKSLQDAILKLRTEKDVRHAFAIRTEAIIKDRNRETGHWICVVVFKSDNQITYVIADSYNQIQTESEVFKKLLNILSLG